MSFYKDYEGKERTIVGDLNLALSDFVLKSLRIHGYEPKDVRRGDTYFIFNGYPNSITHFKLSKVWPGWLFGLWVHGEAFLDPDWDKDLPEWRDHNPVVQLFCQHESNIDKFKPSASELCVEYNLHDFDSLLSGSYMTQRFKQPYPMWSAARLANMVRQHPFLSYIGYVHHWPLDGHPVLDTAKNIAHEAYVKRHDALERSFWEHFAYMKGASAMKEHEFSSFSVRNRGEHCWPPVSLQIWPRKGVSEEDLSAALDRVFPNGTQFGHLVYGGNVLRVTVPLGNGYVL